ncbi:MAG TPA: DmsE family decaheme c-type cytochrome [Steroidobacteraceae bacterium]|nr:DmsE family decaheme c-type cytochrome [Steroidobacteraceae bacterium]
MRGRMVWLRRASALLVLLACAGGAAGAAASPPAPAHPAYSQQGADTCLGCHSGDSTVMGIFRTPHARPNDPHGPFGHGGLQCESCHGPGGAHAQAMGQLAGIIDFGPRAKAPVARQNAQCLACHQSNAAHDWASSPHAAAQVSCAACHRLHAPRDPMLTAATQIDTCTGCHQAQRTDLVKPYHHPLREGTMACTSCHSPHGSTAPAQLVRNTVNETCTSCHSELRGPFLWEHQPVTEDCDNCHQPHGSAQPALLKARPPFLCQSCHEGAGHPSVANTPAGLPGFPGGGGMPSAFLLVGGCVNCHSQVHGSNSPSGQALMR